MSTRNSQSDRRETTDMSAGKYARKPIAAAAFAFIIIFCGITIISIIPSSNFFDPSAITSKIRLGDFPIGAFIPPLQPPTPSISPQNVSQEFLDWLQDLLNNTDLSQLNLTIPPGLLPILGGMWYYGYGPFGPPVTIIEAPYNIPRKWRLMTFDQFDGFDWTQSNNTPDYFNFTDPYIGADIHRVIIYFQINGSGRMVLPLPILWDKGKILKSPAFNIIPITNLTWNIFANEYGDVLLNMTNIGLNPISYTVSYNVTYDPNVNSTHIRQFVESNPPSQGPSLPGKYLQIPNVPAINSYVQSFISELTPFSTINNTYDTVLAALEYFKTRFNFAPLFSTTNANITRFLVNGYGDSKDFASTFAIFLRYLNISTRFIMGGIGFEAIFPPWLPITNNYYWTEVWIPNNTSGGNWVQFDPTPVPQKMYMNNGTGYFLKDARISDIRMVTDHFDLIFNASVNYSNIQNRVSDNFNFTAQLLKNYKPVNRTILQSNIKIKFNDMTDELFLGEIQIKVKKG
ncbi:MAG: transglutaminase family protein [Promethearchaeota archaeon]